MIFPLALALASIVANGPTDPKTSVEVECDLPASQRIKNIGSHVDGAGMCVLSAIEMAARYQGLDQMRGLRDWAANQPGGGYPSKTDRQIAQFCRVKGIEVPAYVQITDGDEKVLAEALASGRCAAVTYAGRDGVHYSGPIAHMVDLVALDSHRAAILDSNFISDNGFLWMDRSEFISRWRGNGGGWAFVWLAPSPPPVPVSDDQ